MNSTTLVTELPDLLKPQLTLAGPLVLSQDSAMGLAVGVVCLLLLLREKWFLAETKKGRYLAEKCGPIASIWVLRGFLVSGILFGGMLAFGIIRPVKW